MNKNTDLIKDDIISKNALVDVVTKSFIPRKIELTADNRSIIYINKEDSRKINLLGEPASYIIGDGELILNYNSIPDGRYKSYEGEVRVSTVDIDKDHPLRKLITEPIYKKFGKKGKKRVLYDDVESLLKNIEPDSYEVTQPYSHLVDSIIMVEQYGSLKLEIEFPIRN